MSQSSIAPIDQAEAWDIVCGIREGRVPVGRPRLTIAADGTWSAPNVTPAAVQLLDTLLPIACGTPDFVIAQIGQSLDGHIATCTGDSHYVTGPASRRHLHRLRALVDAVIVGANTVDVDNPRLTVREVTGNNPARVVLDPHARVSHNREVFTDGLAPTWHAVFDPAKAAPGARALALPKLAPDQMPAEVLRALAARGLRRIMVEGGGITISRFIDAGCVDRLHVMVAPMIVGSGPPALALRQIDVLADALRPACKVYAVGSDHLYDLDLHSRAPAEA